MTLIFFFSLSNYNKLCINWGIICYYLKGIPKI